MRRRLNFVDHQESDDAGEQDDGDDAGKSRRGNRHLALGLPSPLPFTHTPGQAISLPPKMWACM